MCACLNGMLAEGVQVNPNDTLSKFHVATCVPLLSTGEDHSDKMAFENCHIAIATKVMTQLANVCMFEWSDARRCPSQPK